MNLIVSTTNNACRSTILGDVIARTLEFCGADVKRLNHIVRAAGEFGLF